MTVNARAARWSRAAYMYVYTLDTARPLRGTADDRKLKSDAVHLSNLPRTS